MLFFLTIAGSLTIIGLIFIYSSSSVYALERFHYAHYFVKKQSIGIALGGIGLIIARVFPLWLIYRLTPYFFFSTLTLTLCTSFVPRLSSVIHGSSRWLTLGPLSFQPSELLRIAFILYFAYLIHKKEHCGTVSLWHGYLPFMCILGVSAYALLRQPDFGLTVTLCITAFLLLFIANIPLRYLLTTISASVPLLIILIFKKPYRMRRIFTFLDPWKDPHGAGFQIIQSLIAIGSGGLWGVGIGHSKQKFFYLPMQHTDFIFSIIAEETGFLGTLLLLILYSLLLYTGLKLAWQLKTTFATYTVLGFVIMISLQAVINLAVTTGLVPTKGLGLPFVSYGMSALLCNISMLGLIINFAYE